MTRQKQNMLFRIKTYLHQAKEFEFEEEDIILTKFSVSELRLLKELIEESENKE